MAEKFKYTHRPLQEVYTDMVLADESDNSTVLYAYDKEHNTLIKYADRAYEDAIKYYNSGANVLETAIKIGMSTQLNKNDS